MNENQQNSQ
jgi:Starch binding domain